MKYQIRFFQIIHSFSINQIMSFLLFKEKHFLVLTLILAVCQSQCPANFQLPGITTGFILLSDLNSNYENEADLSILKKTYQIQVQMVNRSSPIIFSILGMHTQEKGIDFFDINKQNNTQTSITVSFIYESGKWSAISYRYLISSNSQFLVNTQTVIIYQQSTQSKLNQQSQNNRNSLMKVYTAKVNITQNISQNWNQLIVMNFLKGLKYENPLKQSHGLNMIILNQSLTLGKLEVTFQYLQGINFKLSVISFSYLIFSPSHSKFASYGDIVQKNNFIGNYTLDIKDIIFPEIDQNFYGLTSLNLINFTSISFDSQIDSNLNFNLQGSNNIQLIQFTYLIMGKTFKKLCRQCQIQNNSTQSYYFFEGNCYNKCPNNSIQTMFKNLGKYCQRSNQKMNFNQIKTQNYTDKSNSGQSTISKSENLPSLQNQINFEQSYIPKSQNQSNFKEISSYITLGDSNTINSSNFSKQNQAFNFLNPTQPKLKTNYSTNSSYNFLISSQSLQSSQSISTSLSNSSNITLMYPISKQQSCSKNAYWDGSRCLCKVGYKFINFKCMMWTYSHKKHLRKHQNIYLPISKLDQNQTNHQVQQSSLPINQTKNKQNQTVRIIPIQPNIDQNASLTLSLMNNQTNKTVCLSLFSSIKTNQANIYMQLETKNQIKFKNKSQMQKFLKITPEQQQNKPSSTYCQQDSQNLQKFECLLIYPRGIPKTQFNLQVSYSYQQIQCHLNLNVQPSLSY